MTWARFDDSYSDHPKVIAAGPWGELLDMRAIIWCSRLETDGLVPTEALSRLAHDVPKARQVVSRLVEVGRWSVADGGWIVKDFLDYQPSRADRERDREGSRERMRNARANKQRSSPEHVAQFASGSGNPVPSRPDTPPYPPQRFAEPEPQNDAALVALTVTEATKTAQKLQNGQAAELTREPPEVHA